MVCVVAFAVVEFTFGFSVYVFGVFFLNFCEMMVFDVFDVFVVYDFFCECVFLIFFGEFGGVKVCGVVDDGVDLKVRR